MTERTAIYAGSFDPLTNGHLDVLKASLAVADTVIRTKMLGGTVKGTTGDGNTIADDEQAVGLN